ncbi:MAG: LytTR family transcriptional regulator DNA-binding domain-containing protein [Firmicutes bacterium]|nr:LytTR family transcriptional regulator DNA-binding domain-containing protein [Bacillota bacterium]
MNKVRKFFIKNCIREDNIKYITRDGQKTIINLINDSKISTYTPMKAILNELSEDKFKCINKGIIVSMEQVVNISNGNYTMTDGAVFSERVRTSAKDRLKTEDYINNTVISKLRKSKNSEFSFAMLDKMPVGFFIVELIFGKSGRGVDIVFRYMNDKFAEDEKIDKNDMINHSFYEVFSSAEKKWLVTYADIALNDKQNIIRNHSTVTGEKFDVYCFQPMEGFCACLMMPCAQ